MFAGLVLPKAALPAFDFIVSHGVISWISAENRARLIHVIGQRLRLRGLACASYNVVTGGASMISLQALMRSLMLSSRKRSGQATAGLLDYIDRLKAARAASPRPVPR